MNNSYENNGRIIEFPQRPAIPLVRAENSEIKWEGQKEIMKNKMK